MPAAANGDGQVFFVHHHIHGVTLFVHHDGGNVGRGQCTDDKLCRVFAPQHDIHTLAGKLVGHAVDTGAAHTDAGTDGVDPLVMREHCNLGARAGVTRAGFDLQQALFDLGDFLAEQLDHELGRGAREDDGRTAQSGVNFHDHGADTVT